MPSDRALRWSAFGFGLLFAVVVVLGYIPSLNGGAGHVAMSANGEHQMLGLYMIGTADDVTHGLSAALLLGAALTSARASRLALFVFGIVALVGDRTFPSTIFFSFGVMVLISISALSVGVVQLEEKGKS